MKISPKVEQILKTLPTKPGVYQHKNADGKIIYVGKAVNLRSRVRSYFHKSTLEMGGKTRRLVHEITDIEFIVTDSELEALLLENTLIKKHKPRFNVKLKDDKRYPYIKVHWQDDFPRVTTTRRVLDDGGRYYGPYTASWAAYQTLDLARRIFPYLSCTRQINGQDKRACLYYHIKRCPGPCIGAINKDNYREMVEQLCDFLGGNIEPVVNQIHAKMLTASEALKFEDAARYRDQIEAIKRVVEKQKIVNSDGADRDVIAFARSEDEACVQVFFIRGGKMVGRDYFILEDSADEADEEVMTSFVKQFYDQSNRIPSEIVLQQEVDELMIIRQWLQSQRGADVVVQVPEQGQEKELLELAAQNANETLKHLKSVWATDENKQVEALAELQQALDLPAPPVRIECYDISTLQGTNTVGSMVVFVKGTPQKSDYRRFRIQKVKGQDDFASMQETLRRRFQRMKDRQNATIEKTSKSEESWSLIPSLIIIDGGKGQLNAALEVLDEFELRDAIPIVGLAKKEEELFLPGYSEPLMLPRSSQGLFLIQRIRDEAHRYGVTYHRKLRSKSSVRSALDDIPGIGSKRRTALLRKFGSIKAIRQASLEELLSVPGMNKKVAERLLTEL